MFESAVIDDREVFILYLLDDLTPVDKDKATLIKVTFNDNGETVWLATDKDDELEDLDDYDELFDDERE